MESGTLGRFGLGETDGAIPVDRQDGDVGTRLDGIREKVFLDRYSLKDRDGRALERYPEQVWERVARGIAAVEATPEKQEHWAREFYRVMEGFRFVPGGRILAGAGTGHAVTYYNCFQGDTLVHTRDGIVPIGSLSGEHEVLSEGGVYRAAYFQSYGHQRLWSVTLANGAVFYATGDHQWVVAEPKGGTERVTTRNLKGRRIPINPRPAPPHDEDFAIGVQHGVVFGDGTIQYGRAHVCLFGEAEHLAAWFGKDGARQVEGTAATKTHIRVQGLPAAWKRELPSSSASPSYWRGFIAGLIAADGHVDAHGSVALYNRDATLLAQIAEGMAIAGFVASGITLVRETPPFGGTVDDGSEKPLYRLQFFKSAVNADDLLLPSHRRHFELSPRPRQSTIQVIDVRETDRTEEVFCCVEPETHTITIGHGYLTGQCYVIPSPEDSRGGILDNLKVMTEIMARGGGVGVNLSTLRPRGSYIRTVNGTASGPCSWAELYSVATGDVIQQGGSRRGALMLMLNDDHPDIEEFITVKKDHRRINHANLSVCVSDAFMEAVKADAEWKLTWKGEVRKVVKARYIWDLICQAAWESGEPGVVFIDRYNKLSNTWYYEKIISVNPCVTGDTLIYTSRGLRRAAELAADGEAVEVTVDGRFATGRFRPASAVFPTGVRPVFRLKTAEGYEVRLTGNHQVLTDRGWVEARGLVEGDKIRLLNQKGGFGSDGSRDLGLVLGWLVGDGTLKPTEAVLSFFGLEKAELATRFATAVNGLVEGQQQANRAYPISVGVVGSRDEARVSSAWLARLAEEHGLSHGDKLKVPESIFTGCEEMQRGFLQALFTADGHVSGELAKGVSVRLTSISRELLVDVQRLLLNFGIASAIYSERRTEQVRELPDGKGGRASYECQAYHELVISKSNLACFAKEIGFLTAEKQAALQTRLQAYRRGPYHESFTATFAALVPEGEEPVFDLTEPTTHSFIANGLICHNCGEQGLPEWGVCNLGALNVAAFVQDGQLDYAALADHAKVAIRFLDNVIDANEYFIEENRQGQLGTRRTGLGTMGLADALIKLQVRYGSEESLQVIDQIYRTIRDAAYETSSALAAEKGPFPRFDRDKYLQGAFVQRLPAHIREAIARDGIRNAVLLTQAPTGTTSLLAGVSSGIEPVYDFVMRRRDRTGEHVLYHPLFGQWREAHPDDPIPSYFVSASELTPEEHVRVQAKVQEYTDSSISKTVNAPNSHTVEEVKRLYTLAYDLGCKGITYFRDGSREGVLSHVEDDKAKREKDAARAAKTEQAPAQLRPRPHALSGKTYRIKTPVGTAFVTINDDDQGNPFEVFITVGKAGSDIAADAEALGRLISLALRIPSDFSPRSVAEAVVDQLNRIGGSNSLGFGSARVRSVADAIAKVLAEHLGIHAGNGNGQGNGHAAGAEASPSEAVVVGEPKLSGDFCPSCGQLALVYEEGCRKCYVCGFSSC